jgi:hypothetical protein
VKTGGEGQQRWDHIRLVACSGDGAGCLSGNKRGSKAECMERERLVLEAVAIDGGRLLAPTASTNFT